MDTRILDFQGDNYKKKFGAFFTPLPWAKKLVAEDFFWQWIHGATVLDPTAGDGVFIESFISLALENNINIDDEKLSRLFGIELNPYYIEQFFQRMALKYSIKFPESNFIQGDILFQDKEITTDL